MKCIFFFFLPATMAPSWMFSTAWICVEVVSLRFVLLSLAFVLPFFLNPQHKQHHLGQQLHVLPGGFFFFGASKPYSACLLKTQPVPTYIGPCIPSRPFMLICFHTPENENGGRESRNNKQKKAKRCIHRRTPRCDLSIDRVYQSRQTSEETERSKLFFRTEDPSWNTLLL